MLERTISAVALSNADFPSFEAKVAEAVHWVQYAANEGSQLAVLPEAMSIYKGDGPGNPEAIPEQFNSGMIASISKYLEKLGTQARIAAFDYYEREILKLERTDGPLMGRLFKVMDDTDTQIRVARPWI